MPKGKGYATKGTSKTRSVAVGKAFPPKTRAIGVNKVTKK